MVAVVVQALKDMRCEGVVGREVRRWFGARDESWWPYTFERLCDGIGLEAEAIRERLGEEWGERWERKVNHAGVGVRRRQPLGWADRPHRKRVVAWRYRCR
jgi:hypothetical protein